MIMASVSEEALNDVLGEDLEVEARTEDDYEVGKEDIEETSGRKRRTGDVKEIKIDEMPKDWRHIRHSRNLVRSEYFRTVDLLISKYHMSYEQAVGAVTTVGNNMFGLPWKSFDEEDVITVDTVPHKARNIRVGKALEALTLSQIVEKILAS